MSYVMMWWTIILLCLHEMFFMIICCRYWDMLLFAHRKNIYVVMLSRCFQLNYRLPTVSNIFSSGFIRFRLIEYVSFISVFVSICLKNVIVKMEYVFFRPFLSIFRPTWVTCVFCFDTLNNSCKQLTSASHPHLLFDHPRYFLSTVLKTKWCFIMWSNF